MKVHAQLKERYIKSLLILLMVITLVRGQPGKCDQTPPMAALPTPSEQNGIYYLNIQTAGSSEAMKGKGSYRPDQTYVLTIRTTVPARPFKWFMITAEDPGIDNSMYDTINKYTDVGSLKTLDTDQKSRYSETCFGSVESADNSDKTSIEIHWVSPKQGSRDQKVRIRATVAENKDSWYDGENLTIVLSKDNQKAPDSPPEPVREKCDLCSEARYEIIFNGKWSRMAHPRHYPTKPDENGYSHMVGASHGTSYWMWQQGSKASEGLRLLAEDSNVTVIEREIILKMAEKTGTRTLIRGKRRHHPHMSEPSHALFRVDRYHHLFSIAVGMRPSPDWFLGTSWFELCTEDGWLEFGEIPLYPWDAGTMNGVSYESQKTVTRPENNIERVEVGSFNRDSPFYQMNLNDLKPFAILTVRRLNVYPLAVDDCPDEASTDEKIQEDIKEEEEESQADPEEPLAMEAKMYDADRRFLGEWGVWAPCTPSQGVCGNGFTTRTRYRGDKQRFRENYNIQDNVETQPTCSNCEGDQDAKLVEYQKCFVDCY